MKKIKSRALHKCISCGASIKSGDECFSIDDGKTMGGVYMHKTKYACVTCGEKTFKAEA